MAETNPPPAYVDDPGIRELRWIPAGELTPNPSNWRKHPSSQKDAVRESLQKNGWAGAALYNEITGRLIDGHLRRDIAKKKEEIPVLIGRWGLKQELELLATLDPIAAMAKTDHDMFQALAKEYQSDYQQATSDAAKKDQQEIAKLVSNLAADSFVETGGDPDIEMVIPEDPTDDDLMTDVEYKKVQQSKLPTCPLCKQTLRSTHARSMIGKVTGKQDAESKPNDRIPEDPISPEREAG